MRFRIGWLGAVVALGCGSANEGASFQDVATESGGSGGAPIDDSAATTGGRSSTGGAGGSVTAAATTSSTVTATTAGGSVTTSATNAASTSAATVATTAAATSSASTSSGTTGVSATASATATSSSGGATSAATTDATASETTGAGCECEAAENPDLEHIAYLTDPVEPDKMHVSCCDGCHFREKLARCIVAVECYGGSTFLVEWATCNGASDVCADHGIAADPELNSGVTGSECVGNECEQLSATEAACR